MPNPTPILATFTATQPCEWEISDMNIRGTAPTISAAANTVHRLLLECGWRAFRYSVVTPRLCTMPHLMIR